MVSIALNVRYSAEFSDIVYMELSHSDGLDKQL